MVIRGCAIRFALLTLTLLLAGAAAARAAGEPPPTTKPSAAAGQLLMSRLNCTACHLATESQAKWILPKTAPRLADIGSHISAAWLMRYLGNPQETMPGTTMPDLLTGMAAAERAAAAESLTHYLLSNRPLTFKRTLPDRAAVARGEVLYHRVGCVACHAPQKTDGPALPGAPLPQMAEKWSFDGLRRFLLDPLALRPSGRMPSMRLTDGEAADLAHYLLRQTRVPAAVEVATYHGKFRSLDDINAAELVRTGPAEGVTLDAAVGERNSGLRFTAWLRVDQAGDFTFYFTAAGASRLSVDGKWIAGQESWEEERVDAKTPLHLGAGLHELRVDYVRRGQKPPALKLEWEGPGVTREVIPASRLQSERDAAPEPVAFVVDPAKAAAGKLLYAKLNCAACHDGKPNVTPPLPLASVDDARGCLAETPPTGTPDFHLDPAQRDAVRIALKSLNRPDLPAPTAPEELANTMAAFNCVACHARDRVGGVSAERDRFFTSNGEDLGDEGRIPPRLDGVGDKLLPAWIDAVLTQGARVRPYYDTRMPQFGSENIGRLAGLFVAIDRKPELVAPVTDDPATQRNAGRRMVGTNGLSCIVCHRFNGQPAQTMQVIDLIATPTRVNEDWFRRFMRDPNHFHPNTRMPQFWPDGKSLLPTLLGGDTDRQLAAIWVYLSDGPRARFPEGIGRQNVELIPGGEAIVYRGKLWEAGFRAVAIAYPEQVNAAFDAEEVRLSLLWQGRFLNVGPHWLVQGMGKIRPLGTGIAVFAHGPEFATLADAKAPWPQVGGKAGGLRFRGYQLDAIKRPTLLYSIGTVDIEDFMSGSVEAGKVALKRTIKLTGPPAADLYFRLAAGKLVAAGKGQWRFNDVITLRPSDGDSVILCGSGDTQELLVPIHFQQNRGQIEVDYAW